MEKVSKYIGRLSLLTVLSAVLFVGITAREAEAQLSTFGGPVLFVMPCPCSPNVSLVGIGPPVSGTFTYVALTQKYANFNFPMSVYALGLWTPSAVQCLIPAPNPPFCPGAVLASQGTITFTVGSSK